MTATGYVVKTLSVKLRKGTDALAEYNTAILGLKETPTRQTQTATVASGEGITDVGPTSWTLDIDFHSDLTAGSLHRLLLDNDGVSADLEWKANGGSVKRTAKVVLVAPPTDHTVGAFAKSTVSLPVSGTITTV